jgi:hypothetical protein
MTQRTPLKPYGNYNATRGKVGNSDEKQLGVSVFNEFSSRPVVQLTMEKKYLEERMFYWFSYVNRNLACTTDVALMFTRDKTDFAWCRIVTEMKESGKFVSGIHPA